MTEPTFLGIETFGFFSVVSELEKVRDSLNCLVPCFVVFPSFSDAFPAVFLVLHLFVCPSLSRKYDFNFPAALGETAGKASEEVY